MDSLADKFRSFGWNAIEVDGHDCDSLCEAFNSTSDKPLAVICNTIKGKGVSFIEGEYKWHNAALSDAQYDQAMEEQEK